ncbi:MAG: SBBP repeat-containing protein [Kiritimatiellae bacterium]|nr:SBBP repeat-containing protein [Kiritimatiellia bacterium]
MVNPIQGQRQGDQDAFVCKFSPDGGTLLFSTYLGGSSGASLGMGIAVDDDGNAYVCGYTDAANFPTLNAFQPARNGFWTDIFICKLDPSGAMIYSSYLGGSMFDYAYDVAVDTSGCAYVAGKAWSADFPTVNAFQPTNGVSSGYNFTVTKVAANGASIVYSTYLGGSGSGHDYPCVAVTPEGIACFGGATTSTNYPVTPNAYQAVHAGPSPGSWDAVISVFSADGSSLTYSTFLGGSEDIDQLTDIAIGGDGAITVVGLTQSDNFPVTNAVQSAISGQPDLFVTRFTPAGDALEFSTYLGGWDWDYGEGVAVGEDGSVVVVGISVSVNYPVFKAFQPTNAGGYDCVVSMLSPDGSALAYSTYLGGSGSDYGYRVALDADGDAIVVGRTASANFPTMNPFQATRGGGDDGFLSRLKLVKADQTITFPAIGNKGETDVVGLSATATSGLDVSFTVGSGPATITGGTNLSFTGTGTVSIVASQAGDAEWNAAPSVTNMFNVWPAGVDYCESYSDDSASESINRVRFNTIDNPSGASSYSDFTAIVTELERGNAYVLAVSNSTPTSGDKCAVWVDWNQDFSFDDPGEMTELLTQDWTLFTNMIVAPADALPGDTRMRVVLRDGSGTNSPCDTSYAFGETEDYTVWLGLMDQTITDFLPTNGSVFVVTNIVGLSATASSGLAVSFATNGGPGLLDGTNLTFGGAGEVSIIASQAGDANWNAAPEVTNLYTVLGFAEVTIESAHGSTVPPVGVYTTLVGSVFTNEVATPDTQGTTQYVCTGWVATENLDPAGGVGTQAVVTVNGPGTLTWLWRSDYWLDPSAGPHGAVDRIGGWFTNNEPVAVEALPDLYYHFTNWTGDVEAGSEQGNPLNLVMNGAKAVMAHFAATWTTNHPTPHWWLAQYGITSAFETAVGEDPDNDHVVTGDEFTMNTVPTNGESFLYASHIDNAYGTNCYDVVSTNTEPPNDVFTQTVCDVIGHVISWPCATDRVYDVEYNLHMLPTGWTPVPGMTDLMFESAWITVTNIPDVEGMKYYRLRVRLP